MECLNKCCPEHTLRKSDTDIAATITRLHQEAAQSEPTEMSEILSAPAERGSPSGPRQGDKRELPTRFRSTASCIGDGLPLITSNLGGTQTFDGRTFGARPS